MIKYFLVAFFVLSTSSALNAAVIDEEIKTYEKRTPSGRLEKRFHYYVKDGIQVKHGKYELFYDNGQPMVSAMYQHGKKNGPTIGYYEWINKRSYETDYVAGRQHGWSRQWSPQGKLLFESKWKDGEPVNGRLSRGGLSSGLRYEHRTVLYKNGIKVAGSEETIPTDYERPASTNQLPAFEQFLRWAYPTYEYGSTYPFQYHLPEHSDIPDILAIRKVGGTKGERVLESQLETLTRFAPPYGTSNEDKQLAWENWWKNVGSHYTDKTKVREQQDPKAWQIACKGRTLPTPEKPVLLPQTYTLTFEFRAGDYGGICKENMVLERTASEATLTRVYSTKTNGPKTHEHWQQMTVEQADTIVRAVGHIIDNPWLQNDEVKINQMFWEEREKNQKAPAGEWPAPFSSLQKKTLPGRTSFSLYYASSKYELKDADGNVWWNADPSLWYGNNDDRYNWRTAKAGGIYSFFVEQYPESHKANRENPGWKAD